MCDVEHHIRMRRRLEAETADFCAVYRRLYSLHIAYGRCWRGHVGVAKCY